MYGNVLVGIDGGDGGRDAIALARRLAAVNGTVTLAHVHGGFPVGRGSNDDFEAVERDRGRALLDEARREADIAAETATIGSPTAGRGLHLLADSRGADLLVVGSSRRGRIGRILLGDDTRAALDGSPCAVAIAPAGHAQQARDVRKVGVAFDWSSESEHALAAARGFAHLHGAALSAIEVIELPTYAFLGGPMPTREPLDRMLERHRKRLGTIDGVDPHVVYGVPAEELAVFSDSVDLLFAGSRGYGPLARMLYGSTTRELTRIARSPLLVITRGAREADADALVDRRV
jgi:nucleotide-binding universal stress UspA family protein